ncbi:class B sortase [Paenibacillus alba]|uniref:Class B sortase n=1 Tax=Paenibacillus alba TaxID=1197127 RepID=A0ABU6G5B7_9BACL|nr:class B sortase [Paenibacillus alba]MEC0228839.1 class B sortase [Paenibacillus alba]
MIPRSSSTKPVRYRLLYGAASLLIVGGASLLAIDLYTQQAQGKQAEQLKQQLASIHTTQTTYQSPPIVDSNPGQGAITGETSPASTPPSINWNSLLAINKEIVGWLHIDGTSVEYPVVQHKDNEYYLHKDAAGHESIYGSIFMDYRVDLNQQQRNTIIYGHNMIDGSMFGSLQNYKNKDFFLANRDILLETIDKKTSWEIFSVYTIDASKDTVDISYDNAQTFRQAIDQYRQKSLFQAPVIPQKEDEILTLVTCSNETDDTRLVLHAVKKREP